MENISMDSGSEAKKGLSRSSEEAARVERFSDFLRESENPEDADLIKILDQTKNGTLEATVAIQLVDFCEWAMKEKKISLKSMAPFGTVFNIIQCYRKVIEEESKEKK